ncbi:MAG: hypothetical protein ABFR90_08325 [Planctomycetota bacterium]
MKDNLLFLCLLCWLWVIAGCEVSQPDASLAKKASSLDGLTLSDLQDTSQKKINTDFLVKYRIITYAISPDSVDELQEVFAHLSLNDVRTANKGAFEANGFFVGTGSFDEGQKIIREIAGIDAVRIAQVRLMSPPGDIEPIFRVFLQGTETIYYAKSANNSTTMALGPGFLGWVMSVNPDPRLHRKALIELYPAYWQPGVEDIRLRMGIEPVDYQPISVGQVLARVEERGFILLGPTRMASDQLTLDKLLFFLPGRRPKIQFFLILCDSMGQ